MQAPKYNTHKHVSQKAQTLPHVLFALSDPIPIDMETTSYIFFNHHHQ